MTRREVLERIQASERAGVFDAHIDPIPQELILPVDQNYHYPNQRDFFEKCRYGAENLLLVKPFTLYASAIMHHASFLGRENLKGLKGAVLTCNHVTKFDCLIVKQACQRHTTYVVAAPFNNMNCFLGELMRAGGMLPLNSSLHGMENFNRMVEEVLVNRKQFLLVYPEASMWWNYPKPRPYKDGAFHMAFKYNVPLVPQFITFTPGKKLDREGLSIPKLTLHITKPLCPRAELSKKENIELLKAEAFDACRKIYEQTYGKKLCYTCASSEITGEKAI